MSKIYFKYGSMNSGKTLSLLKSAYNYIEQGMDILIFKSSIDTREGKDECIVKSRTGMKMVAHWIDKEDIKLEKVIEIMCKTCTKIDCINKEGFVPVKCNLSDIKAIFVDEAQFLSPEQIDTFQKICYNLDIPILFYGLKVDFQSNLFPGSKRLFEIADDLEEIVGICKCGHRARQNVRFKDGKPSFEGEKVQIGGNETYHAFCNKCWFNIKNKMEA